MWSLTFLFVSFIFQQSDMSPFANFGRLDGTSPLSGRFGKEKFLITNGELRELERNGTLTCRRRSKGGLRCKQGRRKIICRSAGLSSKGDPQYACSYPCEHPCIVWWALDHSDDHQGLGKCRTNHLAGARNQGRSQARRVQANRGRRRFSTKRPGRRQIWPNYCNSCLKHSRCPEWAKNILEGENYDCDGFLTECCF